MGSPQKKSFHADLTSEKFCLNRRASRSSRDVSVADAFVVTLWVMIGVQVCGLLWMPLCQAEKLKRVSVGWRVKQQGLAFFSLFVRQWHLIDKGPQKQPWDYSLFDNLVNTKASRFFQNKMPHCSQPYLLHQEKKSLYVLNCHIYVAYT